MGTTTPISVVVVALLACCGIAPSVPAPSRSPVVPDASCVPTTCAAQGATCGALPDGCGGTLNCGPACGGPGSCLDNAAASVTLAGLQSAAFENTALAAGAVVDATDAQFVVPTSTDVVIYVGGGSQICWHGGEVVGQFSPDTPWDTLHNKYGMVVPDFAAPTPAFQLEAYFAFDYGKGVSLCAQGDANWTVRGVHARYIRDDCVEDDLLNSGTIDDSLFDGCYDGMSAQQDFPGAALDGSNNLVTIRNSLFRLQAMDAPYTDPSFSPPVPSHAGFWKWDGSGNPNVGIGPKLALFNNVFRADDDQNESNESGMYMAPPPGKLADCENNVMVWLASDPFPEELPLTFNGKPCFTLMTGQAGLDYWNQAVDQWLSKHPEPRGDVGPPVVSLFSPGLSGSSMLSGMVTLVATAVDDQAVAGVQFTLDGQDIGAETTMEATPTKYTLAWDSRTASNGPHALAARARDNAATPNVTTSAVVGVTISN